MKQNAPAGDGPSAPDTPKPHAPGDAAVKRGDCTPAETAAEVARCDREHAAFQARYDTIKTSQFDTLSKDTFDHNIRISGYETSLQNFVSAVGAFSAAVASYAQDLAGRTYSTTALDATADQLDAQRGTLLTTKTQVDQKFGQLQAEVTDETNRMTALQAALDKLSADILAVQKAGFRCGVTCGKLGVLRVRTERLRARSHFTIKSPSGAPPDVPTVPRLPDPPKPPAPGAPGPQGPQHAPSTKVYLSPPSATPLTRIEAGNVWPYTIPSDGAPRICVQVTYDWSPTTHPTLGVRPNGGYLTFQHDFDHGVPTISIAGGLTATDIVVSDDQRRLFFTVVPAPGGVQQGAHAITIVDGPITISLASTDPKDSLTVDDTPMTGVAALVMSTIIAIDGAFAVLPAAAPTFAGFIAAMKAPLASAQVMFTAFAERLRAATPLTAAQFGDNLDISAVAGPHWPPGGTSDPTLGAYGGFGLATWAMPPVLGSFSGWMASEISDSAASLGLSVASGSAADAQALLQLQWELANLWAPLLPGGPS